jgi:hypothetical protein
MRKDVELPNGKRAYRYELGVGWRIDTKSSKMLPCAGLSVRRIAC